MSERKFETGDAFYIAAGRGLAATFFKQFADQYDPAYRVFDNRDEGVQSTLINTVPQDVLDEVRNVFDDLAYNFTQRLVEMVGETDDEEPGDGKCCDGQCGEIEQSPGVAELLPIPAEAAGE